MNLEILILMVVVMSVVTLIVFRGNKKNSSEVFIIREPKGRMDVKEAEQYMKEIASQHLHLVDEKGWSRVLERLEKGWDNLNNVNKYLLSIPDKLIELVPTAQWLIDNHYIIEREVKSLRQSTRQNQDKNLPVFPKGHLKGYPRIYVLSKQMLDCTGYHVDEELIISLLNSYQSVNPLTVNELYVFLDILKVSIIESINELGNQAVESIKSKQNANKIMDEIEESNNGLNIDKVSDIFENRFNKKNIINSSFITHILYRLKESAIDDEAIKKYLLEKSGSIDLTSIINSEGQYQGRLQVRIGLLINSLREEAVLDYERIFKNISYIEKILSNDPIGFYKDMDFYTKIEYHNKIQKLSSKIDISEVAIAEEIVKLSSENYKSDGEYKQSHVGYYLECKGKYELQERLGYKPSIFKRFAEFIKNSKGFWYFVGIISITLLVIALTVIHTLKVIPNAGSGLLAIAILAVLIPAISIAAEVVNYCSSKFVSPKKLPSMDFVEGVPDQFRTVVVMPVVLGSKEQVKRYIEKMETYYLANCDDNLYFALLGDLKDGSKQNQDDDEEILGFAIEEINNLNSKYSQTSRFNLFNRDRKWNEKQGLWMGWERKRGILEEFNGLICGVNRNSFSTMVCDKDLLGTFKYVITIDAGTELVRDSARKLIGIMAHPLNMPIINKDKNIVEDGYTIIQPRIGIRIVNATATHFSGIFAGQPGIDTYAAATSDTYQDIFGEGIFGGKGIYDPRVFYEVTSDEIPENTVLSHDLLESCYVKCASATNVELMDDFPSSVASFFTREHRWIRGDWQLSPWLFDNNPLSALSKYKILDNFRRSLIPVSYLVLIILALSLLSWEFYVWGTIVLFAMLFPLLIHISRATIEGFKRYSAYFNIKSYLQNIKLVILQGIIWFMLIPYRSHIALDAIIRTIYRVFISKKKMLEWKTAEAVERSLTNNLSSYIRRMWTCPVAAVILLLVSRNQFIGYAIVVSVLWALAPFVSYFLSLSVKQKDISLGEEELKDLRLLSRKNWRYFEDFYSSEDNYLIPDNYQEWPQNGIAHRTSTTNIGLQLICTLGARDFGYISINNMINRIEKVFNTLSKLEMWNGHFYNWYDTRTLSPLIPKYISTVDSGNFVGCLIALKNGLLELKDKPVIGTQQLEGIKDTAILSELDIEYIEPLGVNQWITFLNNAKLSTSNEKNKLSSGWKKLLFNMCEDFINDLKLFKVEESDEILTLKELGENNNIHANNILSSINEIIKKIDDTILNTDFKPLYDEKKNLFRIGVNASTGLPDKSYYDLIASEARLASFIAIAKGDVPQKHWFRMGRMMTLVDGTPTLVSWSGTMFEYLMPNLLMNVIPMTMLHQSSLGAVKRQIEYCKDRKIPWGMSEAAYYRFDQHLNYQYRAIGVPGLGFSTDLGKLWVIAPYATILSMIIEPKESYKNIQEMKKMGVEGDYGFYEAIDFINPKKSNYSKYNIVKSFFAHHQGMSFISLCNFINNNSIIKRFHNEPIIKATELILEEKRPAHIIIRDAHKDVVRSDSPKLRKKYTAKRVVKFTKPQYPIAHILSNNNYTTMITSSGAGMSWVNDTVINRWRPDFTCDAYGMFFYIKNIDTQQVWSSTYQPTVLEPDDYEVIFSLDKAEYRRKDKGIDTRTEVVVSPYNDAEIRKVTITNNTSKEVNLEITSYFEVVIDKYNNDLAHPAFSKLFVETEYLEESQTLIASRRPREKVQDRKWIMQTVLVGGQPPNSVEYETDRSKFIGRGNSLSNPEAVVNSLHLTNTVGKVLDTIMSLRVRVTIGSGEHKSITFISGMADSKEKVLELSHNFRMPHMVADCFKFALINSEVEMQYLDIDSEQANAVQDIVGSIYYPSSLMRGSIDAITNNNRSQSGLWRFGISGDYPIILMRIKDESEVESVKDIILAYEYLRMKGVKADLVILNEKDEGYFKHLSQRLGDLINNIKIFNANTKNVGAYLLQAGSMSKDEINLILTVARVVLTGSNRLLSKRTRSSMLKSELKNDQKHKFTKKVEYPDIPLANEELDYFNEIGGFSKDQKEYVILLKDKQNTPAPWINVIANKRFGCHISASGSGFTWAVNSRENKVSTWSNDPVIDPPSEIVYIRDEETGEYFTPTPLPIRETSLYKVRHGFGYSTFEHNSLGLEQKMTVFVTKEQPLKIYKISLDNKSGFKRKLSLTFYTELVLGVSREQANPYIISEINKTAEIITSKNPYNGDFPNNIVFTFSSEQLSSCTSNRLEFLGKEGCTSNPIGLKAKELSNNVGAGVDSCSVIKLNIELEAGQKKEVIFGLGCVEDEQSAVKLAEEYRNVETVNHELESVKAYWTDILGQIKVSTPDTAANYLLNGWLLYQTLACRVMARAGFYQAGGAYGFRDQLQDVLSLLHTAPNITKEMIINHSTRQYTEGDVQHWWHPGIGRGVRTKISDDLLWLPYTVYAYINNTGDTGILDEATSYLEDKELEPDEHDRFSIANVSDIKESIYEHCIKAIERSLKFGEHGLPLMGTGDWNDGMNKVGSEGKGESIWLGWFIYDILNKFSSICEFKKDNKRAKRYKEIAKELLQNIEKYGWDGEWYLRAYFDDGSPLGSRQNSECQIDSISQSWSVISGGAEGERANLAMDSLLKYLVKEEEQIILLLTPPFDKSEPDPGYIKGYIPGIRENGGQYTHAAIWSIIAFAKLRRGDTAYNLFKMINPVYHTLNYSGLMKYKNEPYAISADICSTYPYMGRAGWSWYTGAAGWMYQTGVEWILGIKKQGQTLIIDPTIPKDWPSFTVEYNYKSSKYIITVRNPDSVNFGVKNILVDESEIQGNVVSLEDDGKEHAVIVTLGE